MLPPDLAKVLLRRAADQDDALAESLQDAATYRYLTHQLLAWWYDERQHRLRLQIRIKELMGISDDTD